MARFKLTPLAKQDLMNIGRYTQIQWGKTQRNKYVSQIDYRFHWLADNPRLGAPRNEINTGYRSWPEGEHTIFYRIRGNDIEILGLIGPGMQVKHHLMP